MNTIEKTEKGYYLTCEDGTRYLCERWYEKKTEAWHIKLPTGNPSGRTYVRESKFNNTNIYEFETKTEHRSGLGTGGWRARMTPEETEELKAAEAVIERIKNECLKRETPKLERGTREWYEAEIAKLQKKLESARG